MLTFKQYSCQKYKPKQDFVSKAGAGEWGRCEPVTKYQQETPGQSPTK